MLIENLYTVTDFKKEGQDLNVLIRLNENHDVFKGHFPGNPVMPGVCMLQIIKELTETATKTSLLLSVASNIKFMAIINPKVNSELALNISVVDEGDILKIKNTSSFEDTIALKLSATFKVLNR